MLDLLAHEFNLMRADVKTLNGSKAIKGFSFERWCFGAFNRADLSGSVLYRSFCCAKPYTSNSQTVKEASSDEGLKASD